MRRVEITYRCGAGATEPGRTGFACNRILPQICDELLPSDSAISNVSSGIRTNAIRGRLSRMFEMCTRSGWT